MFWSMRQPSLVHEVLALLSSQLQGIGPGLDPLRGYRLHPEHDVAQERGADLHLEREAARRKPTTFQVLRQ